MEPGQVAVRVAEPLRFLLPARDRAGGARRLGFDPDATLGHLVQSAGVPLTEVGALRLDGEPVDPSARARPGAVVAVDAAPRPQAAPSGGFLADVGLGTLARRLRLLGLDVAWSNHADDAELVARAREEGRMLLTQDRRLLMWRAVGEGRCGALVRGAGADAQLADVLDRFAPALEPLTRCTACGARLVAVPRADVAARLQPGTRRSYREFSRCPSCGRIYWRGAHARRIDALVGRALRQGPAGADGVR